MNNLVGYLFVSFLVFPVVSGCAARDEGTSEEMTLLDACFQRIKGSEECSGSFERIIANPSSAAGKEINLVGYLAPRGGVAMLYRDEHDYSYDIVMNAVALDVEDASILEGKWYQMVRVQARFDLEKNENHPWFGVLSSPSYVEVARKVDRLEPVAVH